MQTQAKTPGLTQQSNRWRVAPRLGARTSGLLVGALTLLATTAAFAQPRFYLSTKKIFGPAEVAEVELEARGVERLDLRVYRLADPRAFLLGLDDPHRPHVTGGQRRLAGATVARELYRSLLGATYDPFVRELSDPARQAGRGLFFEQTSRYRRALRTEPAKQLPPLAEHQLLGQESIELGSEGDGWIYRTLPISASDSGVFLVEAVTPQQVAYTLLVRSALALAIKQDQERLLAYVVEQDSGRPVAGAQVEVYTAGKRVAGGAADANGLFSATTGAARSLVFASRGADLALSDPRFFPASVEDRKVYIVTERPVYKPGQEIFFKGFVRQEKGGLYQLPKPGALPVALVGPDGQQLATTEVTLSAWGAFDGRFALPATAAMGIHRVVATVDGTAYAGECLLKEFVKPDAKVAVKLDKRAYRTGDAVKGTITAAYYAGGALARAQVAWEVFRTRFYVPWWIDADYGWYYSDSEVQTAIREKVAEGTGVLDKDGNLAFGLTLDQTGADYTYQVAALVTDEGGRPTAGRAAFRVTVGGFHLALATDRLVYTPGRQAAVTIKARTYGDEPVAGQQVKLSLAATEGGTPAATLQTLTATTGADGQATLSVPLAKPGYYQLVATADDRGATVRSEAYLLASSGYDDLKLVPDRLQIFADARSYKVGDKVQALLVAPFAEGSLLATAEGQGLYDRRVLPVKNHSALYSFTIEEGHAPNFFIGALGVQRGQLYSAQRSIIAPPGHRFLTVTLATDKPVYKPREPVQVTVTVSDHAGKPVAAELALAVVDEAIYAISPELAVPLPQYFYAKRRNNVRTSSSFSFRFYGYSRDEELQWAGMLRPAHSFGANKDALSEVRQDLRDTAHWVGSLTTDAKGVARASFTLPDNLTTWRLSAWAATKATAVGQGSGSFVSRKDVMVRLAAPPFLVERDSVRVRVITHNNSDKPQALAVSLAAEGATLSGAPAKVTLQPDERHSLDYTLDKVAGAGQVTLTARAEGGGGLGDALQLTLPVLPWGMDELQHVAGWIGSDAPEARTTLTLPGEAVLASAAITVRAESALAQSMVAALEYLSTYPYGCVEQTMSGFLPDVIASRVLKDLKIERPRLARSLDEYIGAGLARLGALQRSDGGWGWWEEESPDAFMTAHVVYGLALARRAGVAVPEQMLTRGVGRLKGILRNEPDRTTLAYGLYALALSGSADKSQIGKLAQVQDLTPYGQALVSLTLQELGEKARALEVAQGLIQNAAFDPATGAASWGHKAGALYRWTHDPIETTATVVRALLATVPEHERVTQAMRYLIGQRQDNHWQSTRDTAAVVYMLADYFQRHGLRHPATEVAATLNDAPLGAGRITADNLFASQAFTWRSAANAVKPGANTLTVRREGGDVYYAAQLRYRGTAEQIAAGGDVFSVRRSYKQLASAAAGFTSGAAASELTAGQTYLVELTVEPTAVALSSPAAQEYVMIEDKLPAGVEVVTDDAGITVDQQVLIRRGMHREVRLDRVAFFTRELRAALTLRYLVRAVRPGSFRVPPAEASLMYYPHHRGYSASAALRVREP